MHFLAIRITSGEVKNHTGLLLQGRYGCKYRVFDDVLFNDEALIEQVKACPGAEHARDKTTQDALKGSFLSS